MPDTPTPARPPAVPPAAPLVRAAAALGLALALGGCVAPSFGAKRASPQIALSDGLVLAAPRGYCVDPASTRDRPEGAFVLFGNCAAIARDASQPQPIFPALLSATLGPPGSGPGAGGSLDPSEVEAFFRSEAGRAVLARSGQATDVELLDVRREGGLLLLKIRDASGGTEGLQPGASYWRAITRIDGRLGVLSVLPLAGARIADADQIGLLQSFAERSGPIPVATAGG